MGGAERYRQQDMRATPDRPHDPAPLRGGPPAPRRVAGFTFVGDRLWLDFVNTGADAADAPAGDVLRSFDAFVTWLQAADVLDVERAHAMRRRASEQPSGAAAALVEARRVRTSLRSLAEWGASAERVRVDALNEINRILGRSTGTRRVERTPEGSFARTFVTVGDVFASLMIPIVDSAADALIAEELGRVRRCADPRCGRVFHDLTRNRARRWCDMATCGNRAKAARHRAASAKK